MTLNHLNGASGAEARRALERCCGASKWVDEMVRKRPFRDRNSLLETADRVWRACSESDWLEAFSHHPQIGDLDSLKRRFASTRPWSQGEQARVDEAAEQVLQDLQRNNRRYLRRFGYIFIVCASGKSAERMLELLRERLRNEADQEILVAAGEQAKITRLRLEKLLQESE